MFFRRSLAHFTGNLCELMRATDAPGFEQPTSPAKGGVSVMAKIIPKQPERCRTRPKTNRLHWPFSCGFNARIRSTLKELMALKCCRDFRATFAQNYRNIVGGARRSKLCLGKMSDRKTAFLTRCNRCVCNDVVMKQHGGQPSEAPDATSDATPSEAFRATSHAAQNPLSL